MPSFQELKSNVEAVSIPADIDVNVRALKRHCIINKFIRPFYYLSLICLLPSMDLISDFEWFYLFLSMSIISGILAKTYPYILRSILMSKVMYPLAESLPISASIENQKMNIDIWNRVIEFDKYRGNTASRNKWITFPTYFGNINFSKILIIYKFDSNYHGVALWRTLTTNIYENCFAYSKINGDLQPFEIRPSISKDSYSIPHELKSTELEVLINDFSKHFGEYIHVVADKHNISIFLDDFLGKSPLFKIDSELNHSRLRDYVLVMYSFYTIMNLAYDFSVEVR